MWTTSVTRFLTLMALLAVAAVPVGRARADPSSVIVPGPAEMPGYDEVPVGSDPAAAPPAIVVPARPVAPPPLVVAGSPLPVDPAGPLPAKPQSVAAQDGPPLSVLIVYEARRFVASQLAEAVARSLDANGIDGVGFVRLRTRPKTARIGFVYGADREAAELVERASGPAFGLPMPVRLAPGDAQTTRPGTVEIDIDG